MRWNTAVAVWAVLGFALAVAAIDGTHQRWFDSLGALLPSGSNQPTLIADDGMRASQAEPAPDVEEPVDPDASNLVETNETEPDGSESAEPAPEATGSAETAGGNVDAGGLVAMWDLDEGDGIPLIGYQDAADFTIGLPLGWEATNGLLTAQVEASGQARSDTSVRVDMAGQPIGSWSLSESTDLELPVPFERIDGAEISLDFVTTTPLAGDATCPDPNHVARWIEVENLALAAEVKPVKLDVARAVRGLGIISAITAEPIHIVTTGPPSAQGLEVIGNLAAAIGHYGFPHDWNVQFDGKTPSVPGAQIWIDEDLDSPARVSVRVVDSRPVLEVSGRIDGLVWLTEGLSDPDRIDYFHYSRVAADDIPRGSVYPIREVFRFEDDGYDDRTLRGSGHQSLIYRIHIPAGVPPDAATLALYATHSPYLATVESTISVRINGSPEEIVAVAGESGQLEALHTITPADLRPGLNYVKISTQLASPSGSGGGCGGAATSSAWFSISNSSGLGVERPPKLQQVRIGIEDARFALAAPVDFNGTDVAIANANAPADVELAIDVIAQLSNRAQGGSPRLVLDGQADRDRHLVVVGADRGRTLLESVPKVTREGASVNNNALSAQALGVVAAEPSPFAVGKVLLAFTGPSNEGARRAVDVAMTSEVNDITTNFAVVSPDAVRPVGAEDIRFEDLDITAAPDDLAFGAESSAADAIPEGEEYDQWVLDQARRIESAQRAEQDRRRVFALSMLVFVSIVAGLWWVDRTRRKDQAGGH